ncbi:uncharacterized protein Z519_01185 [Cladophialophora bantiana CBS 173.52]|uniref:Methyltransferase fungal type helix-turn-helix domain-containing protein n=1 Tax=Cladophialophora bantiana (strain ATCC 10958 / CBS 173.52 / CDC B-1940 / NIH 8579) TaxID=1442370 RepID=A0A0D2F5X8_CLAB1|nr:uncharacterized protein Z519_01185 [Cladophialophora bantiana CBS 173.52]KIW97601.1 hypothetical protein Z519_01185 [Cladophialophora bantiana CBS 173.52]
MIAPSPRRIEPAIEADTPISRARFLPKPSKTLCSAVCAPHTEPPASDPYSPATSIHHAQQIFENSRYNYEAFAQETGCSGFWKQVYPLQSRLVLAYVVEGFENLGCSLSALKIGSVLLQVKHIARHKQLFQRLLRILRDGGLVVSDGNNLIRIETEIDKRSLGAVYENILVKYPQHTLEHKLLHVAGSQLAGCLRGACDASQLLVRNAENRELLTQVYTQGPMYLAITKLLAKFLIQVYYSSKADATVHILEIGGGGGAGGGAGTIKTIIGLLDFSKVSYTYTFADKSPSQVAEVKPQFQGKGSMKFMALIVDKPALAELLDKFHTVISIHGVHATRNLEQSLGTIRSMLREDGFLVLVELTQNMYWLDLVFGLLDDSSWWFHDDSGGRQRHIPTDGASEESRTLRIITGFVQHAENAKFVPGPSPRPKSRIETLVGGQVEDVLLYADVYLPDENEPDGKPRPIGPMNDVSDALGWARYKVPRLKFFKSSQVVPDGNRAVAIGWKNPIYPASAASSPNDPYDRYAGIKSKPWTSYYPSTSIGLTKMRVTLDDERWRFVLHMNWKAQTLPFLLEGLPPRKEGECLDPAPILAQPDPEKVAAVSPYRQILRGNYKSPTYLLHNADDDFIPWRQTQKTYEALRATGVPAGLQVIEGVEHLFDVFGPMSAEELEKGFETGMRVPLRARWYHLTDVEVQEQWSVGKSCLWSHKG